MRHCVMLKGAVLLQRGVVVAELMVVAVNSGRLWMVVEGAVFL